MTKTILDQILAEGIEWGEAIAGGGESSHPWNDTTRRRICGGGRPAGGQIPAGGRARTASGNLPA